MMPMSNVSEEGVMVGTFNLYMVLSDCYFNIVSFNVGCYIIYHIVNVHDCLGCEKRML